MDLPELALENVLVRFPLKSIARFRLISREWKSLLDSDYFRDYYMAFNSSSSVSWSIVQTKPHKLSLEIVSHHGCETWGINRSPGSLMSFLAETTITRLLVLSCTDGLVSICTEDIYGSPSYYIGNPLTQEWVRIPHPPLHSSQESEFLKNNGYRRDTGLVTKMQSGIVVSYKIVWLFESLYPAKPYFMIYSSETELWKARNVRCACFRSLIWSWLEKSISLNGILHWLYPDARSILTYNFYGGHDDDDFRIVHFPVKDDEKGRFKRTITTSEGSIVYFNEFQNRTLRVWRLVKYTDGPETWQLSWEINLVSFVELSTDCFPVVMHPLNSEIIYLWSRRKTGMFLFNLRTLVFSFHKETEVDGECMDGSIMNFNRCSEYMEKIYEYYVYKYKPFLGPIFFSQYVLPRWLHRLPRKSNC